MKRLIIKFDISINTDNPKYESLKEKFTDYQNLIKIFEGIDVDIKYEEIVKDNVINILTTITVKSKDRYQPLKEELFDEKSIQDVKEYFINNFEVNSAEIIVSAPDDERSGLKLFVVGHGEHGKDTFCEVLQDYFNVKFKSSSMHACEKIIYPLLKDKYSSIQECYDDRRNHRVFWADAITEYNEKDKSRLSREIFSEYDIYCGIRKKEELDVSRNLADLVIWVDGYDRTNYLETEGSMTISKSDADIVLYNNESKQSFINKVVKVGVSLGLPFKMGISLVSLAIIEDQGRIVSISRKDNYNDFGLPGGKIDEGETFYEGLKRELKEEINMDIESSDVEFLEYSAYDDCIIALYKVKPNKYMFNNEGLVKLKTVEELSSSLNSFHDYNNKVLNKYHNELGV